MRGRHAGKCAGGKLANCDDGKQCTNDLCDAKTGGCSWTGKTGACDDGNSCTTDACDGKTGARTFTVKAGGNAPACDGAVVGGRCMKAFQAAGTWAAAEQACVVWGGHLARVGSVEENTSMRLPATQGCGGAVPAWIGLNDLGTEGQYQWTDGGAYGTTTGTPASPTTATRAAARPKTWCRWSTTATGTTSA